MNNSHEIYALWMLLCAKQCSRRIYKAAKYFLCPEEVFFSKPDDFDTEVFKPDEISSFMKKDTSKAAEAAEYCRKNGIKIITYDDSDYPEQLKELECMPPVLFVKGDIGVIGDRIPVAIVGTRECSDSGRKFAAVTAYELANSGICIISGMARGIDTYAHKGALLANKPTVAVLPCSVDIVYPKQNAELYSRIADSGAVVSEYLPKTECKPFFFQMRNRLISGLCDSLLVVESDEKGGSMITVRHAIEQNKTVFAVPGPPAAVQSKGTNRLIKDGAFVCTGAEDIINELNFRHGSKLKLVKRHVPKIAEPSEKSVEKRTEKVLEIISFSENETAVFRAISENEPCSVDTICNITGFSFAETIPLLSGMELMGYIEALPGGHYARKKK